MKTLTCILCLLGLSIAAAASEVKEEVLKIFAKSYPGAQAAVWSETTEGYKVFFTRNNISYRIMYNEDGDVRLALKYYDEDNLPPLIVNKVKKAYAGYYIHSVVEESTESSLNYHIILQNEKKIINLKSDSVGMLEVESKYNKG
jgi:hypothetical protein